jgi:serine/threonine-protein kinase
MTPPEQPGANTSTADALRIALSGRYVVERELGRGGMATVYLARDPRHDRAVAVKVMRRDMVAPASGDRFMREIQTAARLTHPHVLGVYDSGEADGLLYYVMPYVAGETLRARLARSGALPLNDAVRLIRELADALAYAHAHGIVHRDLKPENVLLSGGHAVVADFGIAKAIEATRGGSEATLTGTGISLGTPAYMAPEQVIGARNLDHRADLYALGVVAYEILAGNHPFGDRAPQALVAAHLTETAVPLASRRTDAPAALSALVAQLMAKEVAARPVNAEAVVRAMDGIGVSTPPSASRTRSRALVGVAALVIVAAIGAYAMWRRGATVASTHSNAIRTLAVIPFVNTSGTANDDYFSDGLTDELTHALARLPGLKIAGRTSSYVFKGRAAPAQDIGRTLDVGAFVGGTVRRAGDQLRVTTQLVSTADGKVLWDSVYQSRSSDVFAVQDELTRAIVAALRPALGGRSVANVGRGTTDGEAYEAFLKGRFYLLARGRDNVIRSVGYFKQAIGRDSSFARAHAGLAMAYGVLTVYVPDPKDTLPALVAASARRAMALDSTIADSHVAMGLAARYDLRLAEAVAHLRAAIALEPSDATAHLELGGELLAVGNLDEALSALQRATELDPLLKSAAALRALAYVHARRFPEAIAAARQVMAIDSTFPLPFIPLSIAQALSGQPDSAVRTLDRLARLQPGFPSLSMYRLFAYAIAGRWADAERLRAELHRPGTDVSDGRDAAFSDLVFGDREPMVRLLSTTSGQRRWAEIAALGCHPFNDLLWSDERFRTAMRALAVEPCPVAKPWPIAPRPGRPAARR